MANENTPCAGQSTDGPLGLMNAAKQVRPRAVESPPEASKHLHPRIRSACLDALKLPTVDLRLSRELFLR